MKKPYPTPHIDAKPEDFAKTVLMPGDPLRAKYIAENFLSDAVLVNNVRGVQGYTGFYKDKRVSVMASGMGMPSMAIYSYELFNFFGVENIIRIGSAGGISENAKVMDIIIAQGACTDSAYGNQFGLGSRFSPIADYGLLETAVNICREKELEFKVGNIFSSDRFYSAENDFLPRDMQHINRLNKMGVLGVEMEAAALYMNAAYSGKNALAICTISDNIVTGDSLSAKDRETTLNDMIILALEVAVKND